MNKKTPFDITSEILCTGCGACYNECPVSAITMKEDCEGFLSPTIDYFKCINCRKCVRVCPANHNIVAVDYEEPIKYYLAWNKDDNSRMESSSGGVFKIIAEKFISEGGFVCGATISNGKVQHEIIRDNESLKRLLRSKYVQSDTGNVYSDILELLSRGEKVLFSGTPCQVVAMRSIANSHGLGSGLFCVDLVCHGVPSPGVWRSYLSSLGLEDPTHVNFRKKSTNAKNLSPLDFSIEIKSDTDCYEALFRHDLYCRSFSSNLILRKSCYECNYSKLHRYGDITLGDFWGVENFISDEDLHKGYSLVMLNTEVGVNLFNSISGSIYCKSVDKFDALRTNPNLYKSSKMYLYRDNFFKKFKKILNKRQKNVTLLFNKYSLRGVKFIIYKLRIMFKIIKSLFFERELYQKDSKLKKVGILNFHYEISNYGAVLVPYALQKIVKNLGFYPYIINYDPKFISRITSFIGIYAIFLGCKFLKYKYDFLNTSRLYISAKKLKKLNKDTFAFILGSDQIWKHKITGDNYKTYFGDFIEKHKRIISYAASFGSGKFENISKEHTANCENLIKRFTAISVRETSGVEICKDIFGVSAIDVLDPVLLMSEQDLAPLFMPYSKLGTPRIKLAVHSLGSSTNVFDISNILSDRMGIASTSITRYSKSIFGRTFNFVYNPGEWLWNLYNSEFIITDSFHCAVCSIIFKKQFIVVRDLNNPLTDRFISLFRKFDLLDRLVFSVEEIDSRDLLNKKIDYDKIRPILDSERLRSIDFLMGSLNE